MKESVERLKPGEIDPSSGRIKTDTGAEGHQVRELVDMFVQICTTVKTSPQAEGSGLSTAQRDFLMKLGEFFKTGGNLSLKVECSGLLYKGNVVHESQNREGIPNSMYRRGIRELLFYPGVTDWELKQFINVVKAGFDGPDETCDLDVTIQDEDFPHLDCIGAEDYLETHPFVTPTNVVELRRRYRRHSMSPVRQSKILRELGTLAETDLNSPLMKNRSFQTNGFNMLNRLYFVTPDEVERINSQILRESAPDSRLETLEILIEILAKERSKPDLDEIISWVLSILDQSLRVGDYRAATEGLKKLYALLNMASFSEWQRKRIKKAIFEVGTESWIQAIGAGLTASGGEDLGGFARYVSLLQRNATPHLCKLLGQLKGSKQRRILCDALADKGKRSISVFGVFLDDERWFVVRNIVYILGRIGEAECMPYLEKALSHTDSRVRREAVQAILKIGSKEMVFQHLTRKLSDGSSRIRGIAALQLARIGKEAALGPLLDIVQSKSFYGQDIQEVKLFLQALGITGSNEAIPPLTRILTKKSLFLRIKGDSMRKTAADALGVIGTKEAIGALSRISEIGDDVIREASLAALKRAGKGSS
jgi:hypothetical protein